MADFASRFRRHSVFNANLIRVQRPGAWVVATEPEWASIGRAVIANAVPILMLWPSAPVIYAFEIEDTMPPIDRAAIGDPFAVTGALTTSQIERAEAHLTRACLHDPHFRVDIVHVALGSAMAGSVATAGEIAARPPEVITELARHAQSSKVSELTIERRLEPLPVYRIMLNGRLSPAEHLITLAHECGHIFLGHLGPCTGQQGMIRGWPDRRHVDAHVSELEAEAVAWIVASRAGLITGSATYLARHVTPERFTQVDVALVERAASRFERLARLSYRA